MFFENLYKASLFSYKFFKKFMIFLTKEDEEFIMSNIEDGEALGFIYYNQDVINSDRSNKSPYDTSQETREQIEAIKNKLMGLSVSCN